MCGETRLKRFFVLCQCNFRLIPQFCLIHTLSQKKTGTQTSFSFSQPFGLLRISLNFLVGFTNRIDHSFDLLLFCLENALRQLAVVLCFG